MLWTRRVVQQWCFAMFLLCFPVPHYGRPIDGLTNRMKRSVTHAQLMHDKGRTLQDFKRRMWLQELLDVVHTAEIRELPVRPVVSSGAGAGLGLPVAGVGFSLGLGTTGGTQHPHPKPPGGTKNLPINFHAEEEGTNLPQETNKSQTYKEKEGTRKAKEGKKKRGRTGKRREGERREGERREGERREGERREGERREGERREGERREGGEKRKRRARSLGWEQEEEEPGNGYRLEWRGSFFGLRGALH